MSRGKRTRVASGIYKDASGLAAIVKVGELPQKEKRFPPETSLRSIKRWQNETRVALQQIAPTYRRGTMAADIRTYLARVKPTHLDTRAYKQRVREIESWLPRFSTRVRLTITAAEYDAQLYDWRRTLSAKTCNHRRMALGHLYVVLDGKSARNPVRDTVRFEPPDPTPKALPLELIDRVLEQLRDDTRTLARLRLMRWTGMRPSQLDRLTVDSFHLEAPTPHVVVPRGKKGRVVRLPFVSPAAMAAAQTFVRTCLVEKSTYGKSAGRMSTASANRLLATACTALKVPAFNLYRIKHSVGSRLRQVMDVADIQKTFGHMNSEITEIYAAPVEEKIIAGFRHLEVPAASKASA